MGRHQLRRLNGEIMGVVVSSQLEDQLTTAAWMLKCRPEEIAFIEAAQGDALWKRHQAEEGAWFFRAPDFVELRSGDSPVAPVSPAEFASPPREADAPWLVEVPRQQEALRTHIRASMKLGRRNLAIQSHGVKIDGQWLMGISWAGEEILASFADAPKRALRFNPDEARALAAALRSSTDNAYRAMRIPR